MALQLDLRKVFPKHHFFNVSAEHNSDHAVDEVQDEGDRLENYAPLVVNFLVARDGVLLEEVDVLDEADPVEDPPAEEGEDREDDACDVDAVPLLAHELEEAVVKTEDDEYERCGDVECDKGRVDSAALEEENGDVDDVHHNEDPADNLQCLEFVLKINK